MFTNAEGSRVYVCGSGSNIIKIYDAATKKVLSTIELEKRVIPFDKAWGEAAYAKYEKEFRKDARLAQANLYPFYPEHFPLVKDMFLGPDEKHLVVALWTGGDQRYEYRVFDEQGKAVDLGWSKSMIERVVKLTDTHAYTLYWDDKVGEAGVARVPLNDLSQFLATTTNESSL